MKKLTKKLLLAVLSTFMLFGLSMGIGCDCAGSPGSGGGTQIPSSPVVAEISLSTTSAKMIVGDYLTITASTNKAPGLKVEFYSEDEKIATINEHGVIEAINKGATNIVAAYGDVTVKCAVTVDFDESVPEIIDLSAFNNEYVLYKGDTLTFQPAIKYRGRIYTDGEFAFTSTNEDVVSFDGAILKAGTTVQMVNCYIEGTWRGFDATVTQSLRKDFSVKVMTEAYISLEGSSEDFIELYTHEEFDGIEYKNSSNFVPEFYVEGNVIENVEFDYEFVGGDFVDFNAGVITAKTFGQTQIIISCDYEGTEYLKTINVNVVRPEADYAIMLDNFSIGLGTFKDKDDNFVEKTIAEKIYGSNDSVIIEAYQDGFPMTVKDNKIFGIKGAKNTSVRTVITFGTNTEIYNVQLNAYGLYMKTVEDLGFFSTQAEFPDYYYLANDIDATDYTLPLFVIEGDTSNRNYGSARNGLIGVFEGNGHVIKGLTVNSKGIFGGITGGTLQNVAFTETSLTGYYPALIGHWETGESVIKNMYVHFKDIAVKGGGLFQQKLSLTSKHENIVVEYDIAPEKVMNRITGYQSNSANISTFAPQKGQTWYKNADTLFKNCFSISYAPVGLTEPYSESSVWASYIVAENQVTQTENAETGKIDLTFLDEFEQGIIDYANFAPVLKTDGNDLAVEVAKGIKAYHTIADMQAAKEENAKILETFDSQYWVVENGVPYWKGVYVSTFGVSIKNGETPVEDGVVLSNNTTELTITIVDADGNPVETTITGVDGVVVNGNNVKLAEVPTSKGYYELVLTAVVKGIVIERVVTIGYSNEIEVTGKVLYSQDDKSLDIISLNKALEAVDYPEISLSDIETYIVNGEEVQELDLEVIISNAEITTNSNGVLVAKNYGRNRTVDVAQEVTLIINGKKVILNSVYAYTKVIDEAEDLKYFTMNYRNEYNEIDGYFVLAKNIDASALELDDHKFEANKNGGTTPYPGNGVSVDVGFRGVLDGLGYTVDGLTTKSCGLFASMNAPIVKNIAFTNVNLTGYYLTFFSKKYSRGKTHANAFNGYEGLFENIYISVNSINYTGSNGAVGILVQDTFPSSARAYNVVVEYANVDATTQSKIEAGSQFLLFGSSTGSMAGATTTYRDCYAISTAPVLQLKKMPGFASNQVEYTLSANGSKVESVGAILDPQVSAVLARCNADQQTLKADHVLHGVKAYANYNTMATANNDYSSFSAEYWTIVDGIPTWNN